MTNIDSVMKTMTFDFFGKGKHKVSPSAIITERDSIFLDVRSKEETDTVAFPLIHHLPTLTIPTNEIPDRLSEIPRDKRVGIFCASGVRSTMVYLYLQSCGYENVRIIEGGYAELVQELKPGKLLKHISQKNAALENQPV